MKNRATGYGKGAADKREAQRHRLLGEDCPPVTDTHLLVGAGGPDRRELLWRSSIDAGRREPATADGPAKRDRPGSQQLPAVRGDQGGGLRPRQIRLRQSSRQPERLHGYSCDTCTRFWESCQTNANIVCTRSTSTRLARQGRKSFCVPVCVPTPGYSTAVSICRLSVID